MASARVHDFRRTESPPPLLDRPRPLQLSGSGRVEHDHSQVSQADSGKNFKPNSVGASLRKFQGKLGHGVGWMTFDPLPFKPALPNDGRFLL